MDNSASIFDTEFALSTKVDEFALVVSLITHVTYSHAWFICSGESFRMTGVREHFTSLSEDDIDMEVMLGDNSKVRVTRARKISFQRYSQNLYFL